MAKNSKEELQYWDSVLDEYESSIGMSPYIDDNMPSDELNQYLTMNRNAIEKLTPDDCGEIAYRLSQFSFHIQRTINREIARYNWSDEKIKEIIADDLNNYKGYGYVEKSLQAIKNNEKANSLNQIKRYAKQRIYNNQRLNIPLEPLAGVWLRVSFRR